MLTVGPWDTVTLAVSDTVPPSPVPVMVYVVVTAGDTFFHPSRATSPIPLSILTLSAPVEFQKSTVCSPETIASGDTVIFTAMESFTPTVTLSVAVPPGPSTVMVYVVVITGETFMESLTATLPIPWSMLAVVASIDVQVSVEDCPVIMFPGSAIRLTVGTS